MLCKGVFFSLYKFDILFVGYFVAWRRDVAVSVRENGGFVTVNVKRYIKSDWMHLCRNENSLNNKHTQSRVEFKKTLGVIYIYIIFIIIITN